jgi:peroxiredoxin/glutaredoxin
MKNIEGQRVPEVSFPARVDGEWKNIKTSDVFAGKNVIVFSLPGAFTPTCSTSHVPRYNELQPEFARLGIDDVVCVSVNDTFVMNAWKAAEGSDRVTFLPDGNGDFTEQMGMLVDKAGLGFGKRSWRYSMLVRDGVIEKMFIEPDVEGDPYEVSDADTMMQHLGGSNPSDIVLFTRENCGHCRRAKAALTEAGIPFETIDASPRLLRAVSASPTTPRVFVDGHLIGGADELASWLAAR